MMHAVFAVRDTCVGAFHLPMFFQNNAAAVRALGDATNCGSTIISGYGTTIIGG